MFSFSSLFSFCFLSMAPKKLVPSRNRISCRRSDSSSSSIPSFVHFCNEDAQKDFNKNFSDQAIHSECQVILSDFLDIPLPSAFCSRGWASLCEKTLRCLDCSYRSFTPICTPLILLCLSLLWYSMLHVL